MTRRERMAAMEKKMVNKRLELTFSDEDFRFLKAMAKRDGVSIKEELNMIFWTEFDEIKHLYLDEVTGDM